MTDELIYRMHRAMERCGGTLAILNFPAEIKEIICSCPDYETRVKMLEMCAEQMGR